jgi:TupA-like ATPgrasp
LLLLHLARKHMPETPWGDSVVTALAFRRAHGRWPRRRNALYSDALHWLKTRGALSDPLRVLTTDKLLAKRYIDAVVGAGQAVATLAVLEHAADVGDFDFPPDCVIKPTHLCGRIEIRRANAPVNRPRIARWFGENYYRVTRERNYRALEPKVIVEPFAFGQAPARDWSFFCVRGEVRVIVVDHGEVVERRSRRARYTKDWQPIPVGAMGQPPGTPQQPPPNLEAMKSLARKLSAGFSFLRVDLYTDGQRILVGELTHCPGAGLTTYPTEALESLLTQALFGAPRIDAAEIDRKA